MNAITQLRPDSPGSPDLVFLLSAVEAFPQSLAVVDSGVVIYANPAWGRMFGSASPMPTEGRALRDIVAGQVVHGPILDRNVVAGKRVGGETVTRFALKISRFRGWTGLKSGFI